MAACGSAFGVEAGVGLPLRRVSATGGDAVAGDAPEAADVFAARDARCTLLGIVSINALARSVAGKPGAGFGFVDCGDGADSAVAAS